MEEGSEWERPIAPLSLRMDGTIFGYQWPIPPASGKTPSAPTLPLQSTIT